MSDSYSEVQKVQQALVQLKHLEEDFRFKFGSLLQGHLKLLAEAPLNMPAGQPVMVEPESVAELAAPAAEPVAPVEQVSVSTPFVIPAAMEEVPEYPAVAAVAVRPETPSAPEPAAPVVEGQPAPEPPLVWPEELDAASDDETATLQQGVIFESMDTAEDATRSNVAADFSAGMSDETMGLVGDEDPLKGFFFAPKHDGTATGFFEADKGGKSKTRDFEW